MAEIVLMPKLGLTMKEAVITKWLKSVGDQVKKDEIIVEIETDKISTGVESPCDGYVIAVLAEVGDTKAIIEPICVIGSKDEKYERDK